MRGREEEGASALLGLPAWSPSGLENVSKEWIFCLIDRLAAEEADLKLTPKVLFPPTPALCCGGVA